MKALAIKPGFDFGPLRDLGVDGINYMTDGFSTDLVAVQKRMEEQLTQFVPSEDVVVPSGSALHNFMAGFLFGQKMASVRLLIYTEQKYIEAHLDADRANTYVQVANA
jgi:hypothetical protein